MAESRRGASSGVARTRPGLGGLLFERKSPLVVAPIFLVITVVTIVGGTAAAKDSHTPTDAIIGWFVGGVFFLFAIMAFRYHARVFQRGAIIHNGFKETTVLYSQLRTFAFAHSKAYGQHSLALQLIPASGKPMSVVANPRYLKKTDGEMDAIRDALTSLFLPKLEQQLKSRGIVEWVGADKSGARFSGATLHGTAGALLLSRDGYVIRARNGERKFLYGELRPTIHNGWLHLRDSQGKEVYTTPCSSANFFPGLALRNTLAGNLLTT